jgi:hypothetical protein
MLEDHFGPGTAFKDVNDITPGLVFRDVLAEALQQCRVVVAMIGPQWEHLQNDDGMRKLADPDDFVVIEIGSALTRRIPVIPVLVHRSTLPPASQLPPSLAALREHQLLLLRSDPDFVNDARRLIVAIETLLARPAPSAAGTAFQV